MRWMLMPTGSSWEYEYLVSLNLWFAFSEVTSGEFC